MSRPELGRRMGQAINREPYSGEAIRRYEEGLDEPGNDARRALAAVFEKTESYIEFGETAPTTKDGLLRQLIELYAALSMDGRDRLLGIANRLHNEEFPEASTANPYGRQKAPESLSKKTINRKGQK